MTKLLKNNKGFTLVEVIVVAVIVLVLAAVAIPLYNGYINDSRMSVAESNAGAIASAMGAAIQDNGGTTTGLSFSSAATATSQGTALFTVASPSTGNTVSIIIPKNYSFAVGGTIVTVSHRLATTHATVQYAQ